jgi:HSP20 family protein
MTRTLLNLDPLAEFEGMSRMLERVLGPRDSRDGGNGSGLALPVDIYERNNRLFLRAAVPGVRPEDLDVSVENNVLTIRGETQQEWESEPETKVYHREYRYGKFTRSVRLPENLDLDSIDAEFDNGFVTVSIPRLAEEKNSRKVQVRPRNLSAPQEDRQEGRVGTGHDV